MFSPVATSEDLFDRFFTKFFNVEPWGDLRHVTTAIDTDFCPTIDVYEEENSLHIKVELPGVKKEDIDIKLEEGLLTLSGEKKSEAETEEGHCRCVESSYGRFERTVRLPYKIDEKKIDAVYKDGVLHVTLEKEESAKPRLIPVKVK